MGQLARWLGQQVWVRRRACYKVRLTEEAADKRLTDVAMPIHKQAAQHEPAIAQ